MATKKKDAAVEASAAAPKAEAPAQTTAAPIVSLPALAAEPAAAAAEPEAPKEAGKIQKIIAYHIAGYSNKQIIAAGFNKSTVNIQVAARKKDPDGYDKKHLTGKHSVIKFDIPAPPAAEATVATAQTASAGTVVSPVPDAQVGRTEAEIAEAAEDELIGV